VVPVGAVLPLRVKPDEELCGAQEELVTERDLALPSRRGRSPGTPR